MKLTPGKRTVLFRPRSSGTGTGALMLMKPGQSNALRRTPQVTTNFPRSLLTFTGDWCGQDRTDNVSWTEDPFPGSNFNSLEAYTEKGLGVPGESYNGGFTAVVTRYRDVVSWAPAIGSRHWRQLMPGSGSFANLAQALTRGRRLLNLRGHAPSQITVAHLLDHGEADSDLTAPGGGSEGSVYITQAEYEYVIQQWVDRYRKLERMVFMDTGRHPIFMAVQECLVNGNLVLDGSRAIQNAILSQAVASLTDYYCVGPRYAYAYDSDGTHLTGVGKRNFGEYIGWRYLDFLAGTNLLPTRMVSAARSAATVVLTCRTCDRSQIVIDTTNVPETTTSFSNSKNGFQAVKLSDGSAVGVTACSVTGTEQLTLTLASDPGEQVYIRSGQMAWPGGTQTVSGVNSKLARTNIRGTRTFTSSYDGSILADWMSHQSVLTDV